MRKSRDTRAEYQRFIHRNHEEAFAPIVILMLFGVLLLVYDTWILQRNFSRNKEIERSNQNSTRTAGIAVILAAIEATKAIRRMDRVEKKCFPGFQNAAENKSEKAPVRAIRAMDRNDSIKCPL